MRTCDGNQREKRRRLKLFVIVHPLYRSQSKLGLVFCPEQGLAERRVAKLAGLSVDELWLHFQRTNLVDYHPGRKGRSEKHIATVRERVSSCDYDGLMPISAVWM